MPRKRLFFRFADGGMQLSARFIACLSFLLRFENVPAMFTVALSGVGHFCHAPTRFSKNELTYQA